MELSRHTNKHTPGALFSRVDDSIMHHATLTPSRPPAERTEMMRIAAAACLLAAVKAQKAARQDTGSGACPEGWSLSPSSECVADACDVNHIKAPRHGSMGNCATREFEFLHTRPDPIDDTEVTVASLEGALATVGVPFENWGADEDFVWADGAVFWSDPERGPTGSATVAQITVPTGSDFHAVLNFQGKTTHDCNNLDDGDSSDGCLEGNSWQEFDVHFSNSNEHLYRTYRWLTPQVLLIQRDSLPGFTTYRLVVQLTAEARNIYAVFGDTAHGASLPAAYQEADPFGADIGGTHSSFWSIEPTSQFDSFVTLGEIDMEHPDIVDNVRMLASGMRCELQCEDGYEIVGEQPSCLAGAVTASARCQCNTEAACSQVDMLDEVVSGGGDEDLTLYAPETPAPAPAPTTVGRPRPPAPTPTRTRPATDGDGDGAVEATAEEETASGENHRMLRLARVAVPALCVLLLAIAVKTMCLSGSKPSVSPEDAAAAAKMAPTAGPIDPTQQQQQQQQAPGGIGMEGKVETTDNNLFGGMTISSF